jgi:hypothetical protein
MVGNFMVVKIGFAFLLHSMPKYRLEFSPLQEYLQIGCLLGTYSRV